MWKMATMNDPIVSQIFLGLQSEFWGYVPDHISKSLYSSIRPFSNISFFLVESLKLNYNRVVHSWHFWAILMIPIIFLYFSLPFSPFHCHHWWEWKKKVEKNNGNHENGPKMEWKMAQKCQLWTTLLSMKYAIERAVRVIMGPNDASGVIWAIVCMYIVIEKVFSYKRQVTPLSNLSNLCYGCRFFWGCDLPTCTSTCTHLCLKPTWVCKPVTFPNEGWILGWMLKLF